MLLPASLPVRCCTEQADVHHSACLLALQATSAAGTRPGCA